VAPLRFLVQGGLYRQRLLFRLLDAVWVRASIQPDKGQGDRGTAVCLENAGPSADLVVPLHRPHDLRAGEVVEAPVGALSAEVATQGLAADPPVGGSLVSKSRVGPLGEPAISQGIGPPDQSDFFILKTLSLSHPSCLHVTIASFALISTYEKAEDSCCASVYCASV